MDPEGPNQLAAEEIARYSRHLTLPQVGVDGQLRLRSASMLLVGAGGLGSPLAMYLAAAGVGRLGIVDFDRVDLSNLQRQVLYGTEDVGRPKSERARERIAEINPHVEVDVHDVRLDAGNALELLRPYDVVIDGTDNFATRYLVNDACVLLGKPNVYGSIFRFEGQVAVFWAARGPCYRCLYPEPPPPGAVPNCAEGGVLGILPGIIGTLQATEAIKLVLGQGAPLLGRLLLFDALEMRFRELQLRKAPDCPVCSEAPRITRLVEEATSCAAVPEPAVKGEIGARELARRIEAGEPFQLLDVRTDQEWAICRLEGAKLIPIDQLPDRIGELDPSREVIAYCRTGVRSLTALNLLRAAGFGKVLHLAGGIHAWSDEVDPTVPKY